ncbi:hypothetical protein AX774_g3625 [Zancudomyces culisetae]|uniref:CCHC-type domain-containing protein n=1 Tax=Zancudomyces culisetae TaxID=1213189 RepID=A0A1R1PPJ3_ZANCU|nr:hypothetical protein AX774_g3625 [Zancudomyces culisetae]|eukprot:OMH82884.1 hypothetical protein AX774_g3625 [Zancudomyces culisetae]
MQLPKFDSKSMMDATEWIEDYELLASYNRWSDTEKVEFMRIYLGTKETIWFRKYKGKFNNWETTKTMFTNKFKEEDSKYAVWEKLNGMKLDEYQDMDEFEWELEELFERAGIKDDDYKLNCFVRTINTSLRTQINSTNPKTWEEAFVLIKNLLTTKQVNKVVDKDSTQRYTGISVGPVMEKTQIKEEELESKIEDRLLGRLEKLFAAQCADINADVDKLIECRFKERDERDRRQGQYNKIVCESCGIRGHNKYECRRRNGGTNNREDQKVTNPNVNIVELVEEAGNVDEEVFALEKRRRESESSQRESGKRSKNNNQEGQVSLQNIEPSDPINLLADTNNNTNIRAASKNEFSLAEELKKMQIKISLPQLLDISPSMCDEFYTFGISARRPDVNELVVDSMQSTNCKVKVTIFGVLAAAVIDTGAACSIIL